MKAERVSRACASLFAAVVLGVCARQLPPLPEWSSFSGVAPTEAGGGGRALSGLMSLPDITIDIVL